MALDDSGFRDGRRRHRSAVEVTVNELTWQQEGWAPDMICGGIGDELLAPPRFEDFPWPENNRDGALAQKFLRRSAIHRESVPPRTPYDHRPVGTITLTSREALAVLR